jgi:hypothetical protein
MNLQGLYASTGAAGMALIAVAAIAAYLSVKNIVYLGWIGWVFHRHIAALDAIRRGWTWRPARARAIR